MTSADQDAWIEIAQALRTELGKYVKNFPALTPDEIKVLVVAVQDAFWLEVAAHGYDHRLELEQMRVSPD